MTAGTAPSPAPRCASCGADVPDGRDLRRVRTAGRTHRVCPACAQSAFRAGRARSSLITIAVFVLPMSLVAAISPLMTMADAATSILLFGCAIAVHVVVHEAAHALTALAVGMRAPEVELGDGRALLTLRLGSTTVKVGGFHAGLTHLEPRSSGLLRTRLAVSLAAGPLSNLALSAAVHWLFDPTGGAVHLFTQYVVVGGVVLGILNLVPMKGSAAGRAAQTDGAMLLSLLRAGHDRSEQIVAASRLDAAHRRYLAGEPVATDPEERPVQSSDPVVLGIEGTRRLLAREYDRAVALLRQAASIPHDDDTRALTLNNLAWALVKSRPAGWLEEADTASAEALALKPWHHAMRSTRGCVLVHLGDLAGARELLQEVAAEEATRDDRVVLHLHLFRAEHGLLADGGPGNLYGVRAALLALIDDGADAGEIESARALMRPLEVDNALASLVGRDGLISWPDTRAGGEQARHVQEMQRALTTFLDDAPDDPRHQAVRLALGTERS